MVPKNSLDVAQLCSQLALDKKAEHLVVLDVAKLTSYADFLVICDAPSERQAQAIARNVLDGLREAGIKSTRTEGLVEGHWILVDAGDVIFHVFEEDARSYYDLDGFWSDAPKAAQLMATR